MNNEEISEVRCLLRTPTTAAVLGRLRELQKGDASEYDRLVAAWIDDDRPTDDATKAPVDAPEGITGGEEA